MERLPSDPSCVFILELHGQQSTPLRTGTWGKNTPHIARCKLGGRAADCRGNGFCPSSSSQGRSTCRVHLEALKSAGRKWINVKAREGRSNPTSSARGHASSSTPLIFLNDVHGRIRAKRLQSTGRYARVGFSSGHCASECLRLDGWPVHCVRSTEYIPEDAEQCACSESWMSGSLTFGDGDGDG